jgi:hypothetical protein
MDFKLSSELAVEQKAFLKRIPLPEILSRFGVIFNSLNIS